MTDKKPKPEVQKVLDEFALEMREGDWKTLTVGWEDVYAVEIPQYMEILATLSYKRGYEQGKLDALNLLDDSALLEGLSNIEHEQWMKWSKTICEQLIRPSCEETGGNLLLKHQRWLPMWIPYDELSEEMKEHDRKWAKLVLMVVIERLKSQIKEGEKR